ncbi:MAG: glycosyltransferase family 4 protein [Bacillota bacterium]
MPIDVVFTRSNPVDPDPRVEKAAKCLQKAGYKCLVLAWHRLLREKCRHNQDLAIKRLLLPGKFGGGITNFLGLFVFNLWLFFNHLMIRPRIIHAFDLDTVLPALISRLFLKNKVVYDIADWYADSRKVGFLKYFVAKLERWVCSKVDVVILAHENRLQQLGFRPRKWVVINNIPEDLVVIEDSCNDANQFFESHFVYVGVLQPDRGIEQIISAVLAVGAKLTIAGFGPLDKICASESEKGNLVTFRGRVSYEDALMLQRNAIAILALYDPTVPNNRFAAPNKLYEAMMLGRPIITSGGTLAGEIVEREGIGLVVPYDDIQCLEEAMKFLVSHPEERERMGRNGRQLYEQRYSFAQQCQTIQEVYSTLLEQTKPGT